MYTYMDPVKQKPSAYRSMRLGALDKKKTLAGSDLLRWTRENWLNLTPLTLGDNQPYACGTKSKEQKKRNLPSVCRPANKVSEKTPTLAKDYSLAQIKKAVKIKQQGKVINWKNL